MRVQVQGAVRENETTDSLLRIQGLLVMAATKSPQARVEPTQTIDLANRSGSKIPRPVAKMPSSPAVAGSYDVRAFPFCKFATYFRDSNQRYLRLVSFTNWSKTTSAVERHQLRSPF